MNHYKQLWAIEAPRSKTGDTIGVTLKSGKIKQVTLGLKIGDGFFLEAEKAEKAIEDITPAFRAYKPDYARYAVEEYQTHDNSPEGLYAAGQ